MIKKKIDQLGREFKDNFSRAINSRHGTVVDLFVKRFAARPEKEPVKFAHAIAQTCRHPVFGFPILAFFLYTTYLLVVHAAGLIEGVLSGNIVDPAVNTM